MAKSKPSYNINPTSSPSTSLISTPNNYGFHPISCLIIHIYIQQNISEFLARRKACRAHFYVGAPVCTFSCSYLISYTTNFPIGWFFWMYSSAPLLHSQYAIRDWSTCTLYFHFWQVSEVNLENWWISEAKKAPLYTDWY